MKESLHDILRRSLLRVVVGAFFLRMVIWLAYEWTESMGEPVNLAEELEEFAVLVGVDLLTLPVVVWLVMRVVRSAVEPLRRIAGVAVEMRAGHLDRRLDPEVIPARELSDIARELNGAFDRHEEARRRVELFAGNASHQLRTPLAAMQATAESAVLSDAAGESSREAFGRILQESRRLSRLLEQLLFMARLDHGNLVRRFAPVDLSAVAGRAAADFQPWLRDAGIELELTRPAEAPFRGQAELLHELLANLLDNAGKCCPRGSTIRITLAGGAAAGWVMRVEDSGPGIPPMERERLFTTFSRGDNAYQGSGLGLAICREIARLHGGDIALVDTPLGGAAFEVTLPAPA